jgi:hypothetical protein
MAGARISFGHQEMEIPICALISGGISAIIDLDRRIVDIRKSNAADELVSTSI